MTKETIAGNALSDRFDESIAKVTARQDNQDKEILELKGVMNEIVKGLDTLVQYMGASGEDQVSSEKSPQSVLQQSLSVLQALGGGNPPSQPNWLQEIQSYLAVMERMNEISAYRTERELNAYAQLFTRKSSSLRHISPRVRHIS